MSKRCIIKKYRRKAINAYLSDVGVNRNDLVMMCDLAEKAIDPPTEGCKWKENGTYWNTSCGMEILDESTSILWRFCPWCGGKIQDKRGDE